MGRTLDIRTAKVFRPLLETARYKGAFGGRGSGKSNFFAEHGVERCLMETGLRVVCVREIQQTLKESSKRLIEDKIQALGVGHMFKVFYDRIETPGGGVIIFVGMSDHTAESIKSLEGFKICWIEEAQTLSARSLELLLPTIRVPGSEIWASWNPQRKSDAIDVFLRQKKPHNAIVVRANFRDNPWFPEVLEGERQNALQNYPERYSHIWEGHYASAFSGAYFASGLLKAKQEERICRLSADPVLPVKAFFDIGGAGAKSDATAIWLVQFVRREIRVLDYVELIGQPLADVAHELRRKGWKDAVIVLPHDGIATNNITGKRYADHWIDAGFEVEPPIKNTGAGAAMMRIEAVRRILSKCWFDEAKTEAGRDALGFYHERRDEHREIGMGAEHDWSSHAADAFGYMAIYYEEPPAKKGKEKREDDRPHGSGWTA
ncbi:MAG TPA: PBSX family phage terminase large subunit [Xanthobacteraceae bacterium]|jgi:phage terminase large subunit